jgi:cell division control protein 6
MMCRIESALVDYEGYFVLCIDECDHIRRDPETFYTFLIRRLPQAIRAKLTLILTSNKMDWQDQLDPRVKSFLRCNDLFFTPYNAEDLKLILKIRVDRALHAGNVDDGVLEKIAALACREHGDARKAVTLLSKSAYLADKLGSRITLDIVDQAAKELEQDRFVLMVRTAPVHLQAAMAAVIEAWRAAKRRTIATADAYDAYRRFCPQADQQPLTARAFGDLVSELGIYSLIRVRVLSRGRYGRSRDIVLELPRELEDRIYDTILLNFGLKQSHA